MTGPSAIYLPLEIQDCLQKKILLTEAQPRSIKRNFGGCDPESLGANTYYPRDQSLFV